jgi:hypothetical protein
MAVVQTATASYPRKRLSSRREGLRLKRSREGRSLSTTSNPRPIRQLVPLTLCCDLKSSGVNSATLGTLLA